MGIQWGDARGGNDFHEPPDQLHALLHAEHSGNFRGREPPPPPLPDLWRVSTLGGAELIILICRRKRHLGVKYVVTNLISLGWLTLCETQDTKQAKHGQGLNSMMPSGRSKDRGD